MSLIYELCYLINSREFRQQIGAEITEILKLFSVSGEIIIYQEYLLLVYYFINNFDEFWN